MIICTWPDGSQSYIWCREDMLTEAALHYEYERGAVAVVRRGHWINEGCDPE